MRPSRYEPWINSFLKFFLLKDNNNIYNSYNLKKEVIFLEVIYYYSVCPASVAVVVVAAVACSSVLSE
jgi:hypothetical protein